MSGWSYEWFPTPRQAVFDHDQQQVAAVSRAPGNLDLFIVGNDSHVWTTYWNDQAGWSSDWFPVPGQAVFDHDQQQVAAVSRAPGNLDLFIVGNDSHVWTTYWNDQAGWSSDWFPVPGQAVFDHDQQQVAAVSRAPGNLDLFIVGNDSHVWTTYWNDQAGWSSDWFPVPGQAVFDRDSQQVAAVSRAPGNLDLFIVGNDSHVWTTYWNDQAGWSSDWFPVPGQAVFDHDQQQVAAVSRAPGNLDLFIVGNDSHVWTTYWNDQAGWSSDWFPVPGQAVFDHDQQQVAAVSRAPGNLDLFIVGNDSHVWTTYWNDQAGWSSDWFPVPGQAVFDRNSQQVAAVSRAPGNLDLFIVGNDSHVWSTWWGPYETTVHRLIDNGPDGAKVTIVAVGDGFTVYDQHAYDDAVDSLLTNGLFAHDYYADNRDAFNLVRINVYSAQSGVSTKTYDDDGNVTAQTMHDTALGAIFNGDWAHCWVEDGPDTGRLLNELLAQYAPEHRLVILLLNNPGFGGCGGGGRATLPLGVTWATIAHEFGHALGGLADEYHNEDKAWTGGEPGEPNATKNTSRATLKWGWAVAATTPLPTGGDDFKPPKPAGWNDNQGVGAFEGGHGNFATGVFRPVINCRMKSNNPPFCPVCNAAMSAQTNPFLSPSPAPSQATPEHAMADESPESYVRMQVRLDGDSLSVVDAREIDGPLVEPETVTHGLAHEVLVDGRRIAVGSTPDAGISRSFSEIGPEGPRDHHIQRLDSYEFPIRIPTADLRGAKPDDVRINVVDVHEQPQEPLRTMSLIDDPEVTTSTVATTTLAEVVLPDAVGRVMGS